jgi:capsule biosynthesis phosphatase
MSLIFLCGGQGKRFQEVCPRRKPCQLIFGRPMYTWVLESIFDDQKKTVNALVIATHDDDNGRSIFYNIQKNFGDKIRLSNVEIGYNTRGPIESCKLCLESESFQTIHGPFWVLDNDILYDRTLDWNLDMKPDQVYVIIQKMSDDDQKRYTKGQYSPYSHVILDDHKNKIVSIVEKVYISEYIVLGAYGFGSVATYNKLFNAFQKIDRFTHSEWFMSSLIQTALDENFDVRGIISQDSCAIGTPEQVQQAIVSKVIQPKPLRWVFDLDETLVTLPSKDHSYDTVKPIWKTIEFLRHLYNTGHYIIIHTARHMKTCQNDVALVQQTIGKITEDTLEEYDIPYHELVFGKPYGDVYIDDKASNPVHWHGRWMTGSIGFGWNEWINEPTSYRKIVKINDDICYKLAESVEGNGNIYFVNNCPQTLKEHIPKIFECTYQENGMRIVMEWKNDAIPVGKLLSHNLLTDDVFEHVLGLLEKIHNASPLPVVGLIHNDILQNYFPKFITRYNTHAVYKEYDINVHDIRAFFERYVPTACGCIHGDFWMSNLLWSHKEKKLYMIDMRGRLGAKYTIMGDRFYDYAKLMQSIVGFDSIVSGRQPPSKDIQDKLTTRFIERFKITPTALDHIKKITAFLILGSLPFHEELKYRTILIKELLVDLWSTILS